MARIQSHEFVINEDRCFGCELCVALCPVQVLTLTDRMIYVDERIAPIVVYVFHLVLSLPWTLYLNGEGMILPSSVEPLRPFCR